MFKDLQEVKDYLDRHRFKTLVDIASYDLVAFFELLNIPGVLLLLSLYKFIPQVNNRWSAYFVLIKISNKDWAIILLKNNIKEISHAQKTLWRYLFSKRFYNKNGRFIQLEIARIFSRKTNKRRMKKILEDIKLSKETNYKNLEIEIKSACLRNKSFRKKIYFVLRKNRTKRKSYNDKCSLILEYGNVDFNIILKYIKDNEIESLHELCSKNLWIYDQLQKDNSSLRKLIASKFPHFDFTPIGRQKIYKETVREIADFYLAKVKQLKNIDNLSLRKLHPAYSRYLSRYNLHEEVRLFLDLKVYGGFELIPRKESKQFLKWPQEKVVSFLISLQIRNDEFCIFESYFKHKSMKFRHELNKKYIEKKGDLCI